MTKPRALLATTVGAPAITVSPIVLIINTNTTFTTPIAAIRPTMNSVSRAVGDRDDPADLDRMMHP